MKIRYKFAVEGKLRITTNFPIQASDGLYEFECDPDGLVTHLCVSFTVQDQQDWPTVTINPEPGIRLHLNLTAPKFDYVQKHVRTIEGLLSMWGVSRIDFDYFERTWIPENALEEKHLQLKNFSNRTTPAPTHQILPTPFDLVARSVMSADQCFDIEIALGFFRKGTCDVNERRYIEAYYDFYFMLEHLFADGKFKSDQVEQIFLGNATLITNVKETLVDEAFFLHVQKDTRNIPGYSENLKGKTPQEIIHHLVSLRGFLHHHSQKRKDIWHPDDHFRFGAEAIFLQHLCHAIAFGLASPYLYREPVMQEYQAMYLAHQQKGLQS